MTLRSQLKVPRFGLFYFESDKTLSVVPLKKVSKVLEGTNTTEGSVVEIFYGNVLLKAKIIAVDDDDKKLHRRELAFLCDEANRHLFPADTDDETSDLEGQARAEPIVTTNNEKTKKQSKKRKRADDNQPSTSEASQKKAKGKKDKSAATVVGRFSPSKGAQPVEADLPEPDLPEPVGTPQRHETPTVEQANSPSTSCGQTPSTIGPPAAQNSYDQSASRAAPTTTNVQSASPFNSSFNSISPSSPWFSQPRTSRQHRSHVSRHLFADMPVYSYGLPPELWSFLQRLDRRLDYLTGVVEDLQSASHHPVPLPTRQLSQQSANLNVPTEAPPDQPEQSNNLSQMSPESASSQLPHERLMTLRAQASSSMNFAVRLLRELCPTQELIGKNINGVRGKQAVEPNKVELIRTLVKRFYPSPPGETERIWRECRKAMDSFLRKIPTRQN